MATPYQERELGAPALNPGDEVYFEAAREGRLLIKRCADCNQPHFYPRPLCPHCFSDATRWIEASGTGTIYTFSVTRRAGPIPYAISHVTLTEGVTMMSNIVDCDLDDIHVGQAVKVVFQPSEDGWMLPCFTPT
ncbi:Zn-ribbon domain-containing OB-fold protein [Halomonas mongoliensis]|uniref:Zn-ribbon domain-containing OB-fold protein n=1 Tax=Halomonas mongoliensis TaxID=321265 RepID=UPI00403ADB69